MNIFGDLFPAAGFLSGGEGGLFIYRVAFYGSEVVIDQILQNAHFHFEILGVQISKANEYNIIITLNYINYLEYILLNTNPLIQFSIISPI